MRWSLPININIAGTLRAWRSEIISSRLISEDDFAFTDYVPTLTMASGVVSSSEIRRAKWVKKLGSKCDVSLHATWTASLATASLTITLPFSAKMTGNSQGVTIHVFDNGAWRAGVGIVSVGTNNLVVTRYDAANFTAGTVGIMGNFWYEID